MSWLYYSLAGMILASPQKCYGLWRYKYEWETICNINISLCIFKVWLIDNGWLPCESDMLKCHINFSNSGQSIDHVITKLNQPVVRLLHLDTNEAILQLTKRLKWATVKPQCSLILKLAHKLGNGMVIEWVVWLSVILCQ